MWPFKKKPKKPASAFSQEVYAERRRAAEYDRSAVARRTGDSSTPILDGSPALFGLMNGNPSDDYLPHRAASHDAMLGHAKVSHHDSHSYGDYSSHDNGGHSGGGDSGGGGGGDGGGE